MSDKDDLKEIIDEATFDFTMGEETLAIEKLGKATESHPDSFEAWHALAEIHYSLKNYDQALETAERAHEIKPADLFINTSLSRIWLERGDKEKAEFFGAKAKMQSWKEQLEDPKGAEPGIQID